MPLSEAPAKLQIPLSLVTNLIAEQFPQWAHLSITPVEIGGWDNRTFHLGQHMSIRLPSAEAYATKVEIEQKWLPILAPHLSLDIPAPIAMGKPSTGYPFNWSIYKWIEGKSVNSVDKNSLDLNLLALDLANFLNELHKINITGGPLPGLHNFYRGDSPIVYDKQTRSAILKLKDLIDADAAINIWQKAISSKWDKEPVWIHGDLSIGNMLVKDNKLVAIIDFGGMAIGDPACDLVIVWNFLTQESRKIFKQNLGLDANTWTRARGWALWKALITLEALEDKTSPESTKQQQIINGIINEHKFEIFF